MQFPSLEERKKKSFFRRNGHRSGLTSEASRLHLPGPLQILSRKSTFFFLLFVVALFSVDGSLPNLLFSCVATEKAIVRTYLLTYLLPQVL